MIKIHCNKLREIEQIHLDACLAWVMESTKFLKQYINGNVDTNQFKIYKSSFNHPSENIKDLFGRDNTDKVYLMSFLNSIDLDDIRRNILIGKPRILESKRKDFQDFFEKENGNRIKDIRNLAKYIFNYKKFAGIGFKRKKKSEYWNAYEYTKMLEVNVCPYCNRNFTTTIRTVKDKKIIRPQIDHFIPQSKSPLLAISLYNMIPCCSICNSILKRDENVSVNTHIHPLLEGFGKNGLFDYEPQNADALYGIFSNSKHKIKINTTNKLKYKINASKELFCIEKIYESHSDIINELITKKRSCDELYLDMIIKMFPKLKLSKNEAYRLAFGNYYESEDFQKRPLSKFTRDIAEKLELI